jgi:hypothetical protein
MVNWKKSLVAPVALAAATLLPGCKNEYYEDETAKLAARLQQCATLEKKAELLAIEGERAIKDTIYDFAKRDDKSTNFEEKFKRDDSHFLALVEVRAHAITYHRAESDVLFRPLNDKLDRLLDKINDPKNGDRYLAKLAYPGEEGGMTKEDAKNLRRETAILIHHLQFGKDQERSR